MYKYVKHVIAFILLLVFVFYSCNDSQPPKELAVITQKHPSELNFDDIPFKHLSEYGIFVGDMKNMKVNDGVLYYEPSSALFTDYAHKTRYVWMPKDSSASILANEWQQMDYPNRTILVKNFYYPKDFNKPNEAIDIVETRLLVKYNGKWTAYPYIWNEDETDADYKVIGASIPVTFTNYVGETHTIDYLVPNKHQCKSCHNQDDEFLPIGPKARNLNFNLKYSETEEKNQLEKWAEYGYLENFTHSENYQSVPNYQHKNLDINARARAYLDANCAHCHNPMGPGSTSGLFFTYELEDTNQLGYYKTPVAAGIGAGPHTYDLYPGKADSSIITYRMESTQPGIMMAELGRVMIHEEGVALIKEWINQLE